MSERRVIRVGSRKSELALIQTNHVISLLKKIHPDIEFEIVTMSTLGDKVLNIPLPKIGEKSLFTKELETALVTGCVDFVVHSLKDLPTTLPDGMVIGAVLTREDPRDALVLGKDYQELSLETLPANSVIGTSSLRRTAQLAKKYPHLKVESIRGNLNTRLKKLDDLDTFHGIILAAAGLYRMGWEQRISKVIEEDQLLYAVGQGALAVECRQLDNEIIMLLRPLFDPETAVKIIAERSFLRTLGGGCSAPVAVTSNLTLLENKKLKLSLKGAVWSLNGEEEIMNSDETTIEIKDLNRCAACPFGYKSINIDEMDSNKNQSSCSKNNCTNTDIECLNQCSFKRPANDKECPFNKKQKLEDSNGSNVLNEIPADLIKDDPHEHCPVKLPVGADFMGKCPYLESNLVNINPKRCPVYGQIEGAIQNFTECPFLKDGAIKNVIEKSNSNEIEVNTAQNSDKTKLYVGLVPHNDVPEWSLDEAQKLGSDLAEKLMKKGATEVMAKAQAVIRSS